MKIASSGSADLLAFGFAFFLLLLRGLRSMLILLNNFWKNNAVGANKTATNPKAIAIPTNKKV